MALHRSDFEKGKIIASLENDKTIAEVSFETGRSRTTIERWKRCLLLSRSTPVKTILNILTPGDL